MRRFLLGIFTAVSCCLILSGSIKAQNCGLTNMNNTTITLLCNQVCTTLVYRVPHIKGTTDYLVTSIPYTPYPFTTPTGTEVNSIYVDDTWSNTINIGFPFCYYGNTFNSLLMGSNAAITFDVSRAGTGTGWTISPTTGAIPNTAYAPNMIFGPYHDINPAVASANKKIEWRLECTAPNRKFVASYNDMPYFGTACTTPRATHQMVLHEGTGIVDVYLKDKPFCTGWNNGLTILGMQDGTRTNARFAPGKNATVWEEYNTAYRFTPSGGASHFVSSQMFDMSGTLIVSADTSTTTPSLLDLSFPNICAPPGGVQYEIVTTFTACDNPSNSLVYRDTITINRSSSLGATATATNSDCGPANGTITVTVPPSIGTPPYTFVLDGGTPVTGPGPYTFTNVSAGAHTVVVTDATAGCTNTINITVNLTPGITANIASTATACTAAANGTVTITPTSGTGPYTFSLDGAAPVSGPSPYTFTNLGSGPHTILVTDAGGCNSGTLNFTIAAGPGVSGSASQVSATCTGSPSGSITVNATAGTAPFTFQLDAGAPQSGPSPYTFTGILPGAHTVIITDALGCTRSINITVFAGTGVTANATQTATTCPSVNNGTITVNATVGTAPYTYQLDAGTPQSGANPYTFTGVASGAHTVIVRDANGCTRTLNVNVVGGAALAANAVPAATSCSGASDGTITVTPTTGTAPYTFSLDGAAFVPGAAPYTFTNLAAGPHTISVTDALGCVTNVINVNIAAGPALAATATGAATSCSGASNGSITVTPTNGAAPYTFSLDGGAPVAGAAPYTFTNVPAGPHTIVVSSGAGCTSSIINVDVVAGPNLTTTVSKTDVLCFAGATGSITVTQPTIGNPPYEYSLDNTTWQLSNVFNGLIAGTYTVYYREANGCVGSQTIVVAEPPVLSALATSTDVVCNGQANGIISVSSQGGVAPYEYSIDGGTTWQPGNVFNVPAGVYTVTVRDFNGCIVTNTLTMNEPPVLSAVPTNTNASCDGGNDGTITVNATGGNGNYEYSIDNGATWQSGNIYNVAPGNYTILVRDLLGCTTTFNTTVGLTNNLTFTPQLDPTICESKSTQLDLVSNATSYSWSPATALSSSTIHNPVANPVVTTQYVVTATLGRCTTTDTVVVNVNPAPIPDAGPDGFICYGQTYNLNASGGTVYTWTPSTYLSDPNIANPVSTPAKDITYTLTILSDVNGCASLVTDDIRIDVTPPVKVKTFPYDTVAYPGDRIPLLAIPSDPDANIYTWSPSIGLDNTGIANPIATIGPIGSDITYRVITSTIAGCKGEGFVHIKVYTGPDLYVPTGFTPNGDGRNDRFTPFPVGIKSLNYFRVYNRWGQLVFSTNALHTGWDGTLGGRQQSSGTYVWMAEGVTLQGKLITKKGIVTLIR